MLFMIVSALLLSIDATHGTPVPQLGGGGALIIYKTVTSYDEAQQQCLAEGGVLASPVTEELQKVLRMAFDKTAYFIGLDARFHLNTFVSADGVRLDEMPVGDMYDRLDLDDGQCLSMDGRQIRVIQCTSRLPYACYNKNINNGSTDRTDAPRTKTTPTTNATPTTTKPNCGTDGYTYYSRTGSCYKIHAPYKSWDDAAAACRAEHAHLLVVDDEREAQLIRQTYSVPLDIWIHLGLRDYTHDGDWQSVTGKHLLELHHDWYENTPTLNKGWYCGVFHTSGRIYNAHCNDTRRFICEK